MKGEREFKLSFRCWGRITMGATCLHAMISCLGLLWDPCSATYCWPNITWRSLLSAAAPETCHSLETLQISISRHRWKSGYFPLLFFFCLTSPCSSRGASSLSLEDSSKSTAALRFMSVPHSAMSTMLRVHHVWVIFTSFPITVSATIKPAKLSFANKLQCDFQMWVYILPYTFRFRHSLEHNPFLQPASTMPLLFCFPLKTCVLLPSFYSRTVD